MSKRNNFFVKSKLVNEEKKFYIACEYGDIEAEDLIFDDFNVAYDFVKNNQETLDNLVNTTYISEPKKEKSKKSKTSKKGGIRRLIAGFLAGVVTLTSGHFIGKGIKETIEERNESKPLEDTLLEEDKDEVSNFTYNFDDNSIIVNEEVYEELTTEKFEELCTDRIKEFNSVNLPIDEKDTVIYVMGINSDKLAEDNRVLLDTLIGEKTEVELINDTGKVCAATAKHNLQAFKNDHNTDNFILVSDSIFGEQKDAMLKVEEYINQIVKNYQDNDKVNELVTSMFEKLNAGELSKLDDGVGFSLSTYLILIDTMNIEGHITLNEENASMLAQLITSEKYVSNMQTIFAGCQEDIKTLTR